MSISEQDYLRKLLEEQSCAGNGGATATIATLYIDQAMQKYDETLLDVAEEKFLLAAKQGHLKTQHFLEVAWLATKAEYFEEIRRRKSS